MRIMTRDQDDRAVLDFHRCAMLPARVEAAAGGEGQSEIRNPELPAAQLAAAADGWDLSAFRNSTAGPHFQDLREGSRYRLVGGDVVTSAPELARLTMNLAAIHHDWTASASGKRLVYGGHTIGLAAAQITRALPAMVTILAWRDCDHLGPVHEGDTLHSQIEVERCEALPGGGGLVHLRSTVRATDAAGAATDVLDWRLVGLFA